VSYTGVAKFVDRLQDVVQIPKSCELFLNNPQDSINIPTAFPGIFQAEKQRSQALDRAPEDQVVTQVALIAFQQNPFAVRYMREGWVEKGDRIFLARGMAGLIAFSSRRTAYSSRGPSNG